MATQIISLSLPAELLIIINEAAKDNFCTRSDYIRESVVQRLKEQYQDPKKLKQEVGQGLSVKPNDEMWV